MKKIMTLLLALTTVIAFGQTERKFPGGGGGGLGDPIEIDDGITPKKDYCGTIQYLRPPVKSCHNPAHFDQGGNHKTSFEFEDRFGNVYCDEYFNPTNSADSRVAAIFSTYSTEHFFIRYDHINGEITSEQISIINQLFNDLETFLVFNQRCDVTKKSLYIIRYMDIDAAEFNNNRWAAGTGFYRGYNLNEVQQTTVWKAINKSTDLNSVGGLIEINPNHTNLYYTGLNAISMNSNEVDFYGILLHEIIHTLGFAFKESTSSIAYFNTLLRNQANNPLYDLSVPYKFSNIISPSTLTNCGSYIQTETNSNPFLQAPISGTVVEGNTFSHINSTCYTGFHSLMSPNLAVGETQRITTVDIDVLHALGYRTNTQYGETTTSFINPNIITGLSISHINPSYPINDPCASTTNFNYIEVDGCTNGFTFNIDDDFKQNIIINNDVLNEPLSVNDIINIEIAPNFTDFANYNSTTGVLTFNTNAMIVKLRYQLRSNTYPDYITNEGVISFYYHPCYDDSFYCNEPIAIGCDYICNSELDDNNTIINSSNYQELYMGILDFHSLISPYINGNTTANNTINGWFPWTGTTSVTTSGFNPIRINNSNYHFSIRSSGTYHKNAIITKLKEELLVDTPYILSYFSGALGFLNNYKVTTGFCNIPNGEFPDILSHSLNLFPSDHTILQDNISFSSTDHIFNQHIKQFSLSNTYKELLFAGSLAFDNVSLIKDDMAIALQNSDYQTEITACDTDVILGLPLCQIDNMHYDWYNTTTGVQLSHDSNLLAGVSGYTVIGNGSQLQIDSVTESGTYKLKRSFYEELVDSEGNLLPIVENIANLEVLINVNFAPFPALGFGENNHGKIRTNIALDSQDNVFVTGSFSDPSPELVALIGNTTMINLLQSTSYSFGAHQGFIMKLDSCGNFVTAIPYTSVHEIDIEIDSDDNIYTRDTNSLRKYDNNLNVLWSISPSSTQNKIKVSDDPSLNIIVDISRHGKIIIYKKSDGSLLNIFDFNNNMYFYDIILGNNGDIYFSGKCYGGEALYNGVTIPNESYFLAKGNISSSGGSYNFNSQNIIVSTGGYLWRTSLAFSYSNNFLISTYSYHDIQSFDSNLNQIDSYTDFATSNIEFNNSNNSLLVSHYIKEGGCNYLMNKLTMDTSGHFISEAWRLNDAIADPSHNHFFYNKIAIGKNDPSKIHISGEYRTDASYFNLRPSTSLSTYAYKMDNYLLRLKDVGSSVEVGRVANPNIATTDTKTLRKPLVFPNPFQEELRIAITNGTQQVTGVSLSNALGSKLTISYNKTATHYTIDTARLAKGYYYLTISYSDGTTSSTVVFKQ